MKRLFVVGIGPGGAKDMTYACRAALDKAEVIVGYTAYVQLVRPLYPETPTFATPMLGEVARCRRALEFADAGKTVALVCSGDPGVYGMASLVLELGGAHPDVEIAVVPGVTAALAGAALLGAPLAHDFAVVSLSDLLTPWALIETRLTCAAMGDFCLALYNPSSKKRVDYLQRACEILLKHKAPDTLCGVVRNVGREGEAGALMTLEELRHARVDMFTTAFVGNTQTQEFAGRMVTPRGYRLG